MDPFVHTQACAHQLNRQLAGELSTLVELMRISVPGPAVSPGLAASAVIALLGLVKVSL